jgi:hypothetical protein
MKLEITVDASTLIGLGYDELKVYRSETETGSYSEISSSTTRITLVGGTNTYNFSDTTATHTQFYYKYSAYDSSLVVAEGSLSSAFQALDADLYATIQDIRDEGVTETELTDARCLSLLNGWQAWLDKMCGGNFFIKKTATVDFDGDGSRLLQLPIFLVTCTNLYVNDDFNNALDSSYYAVYNSNNAIVDDRKNPRIKIKTYRSSGSIFVTAGAVNKFIIGEQNQRVEGIWGHVEADGSTPYPVRNAIKTLVIATKEVMDDADVDRLKFGKINEEVTDRHRIEYADLFDRLMAWDITGITEVDTVIRAYRRPTLVTSARNLGFYRADFEG